MKSCAFLCAIAMALLPLASAYSQDHPFSVKDDIAMVRFSDPYPDHSIPGSALARKSPDGKYVAVVTTRGLLDSDQLESEISVFDLADVSAFLRAAPMQPPAPRIIAKIVSFPHREEANAYAPVIKDLRWSPDMTHIYFKGENSNGAYQLYRANVDGSGFHALTSADFSVGRFDVANDTLVYTASQPFQDRIVRSDSINSDAQVMTGHSLEGILFPGQLESFAPETFKMTILDSVSGSSSGKEVPGYSVREIPYMSFLSPFLLSPKGDELIAMIPASTVPDSWKTYDPATGYERLRLNGEDPRLTSAENFMRPQRYSLIDFRSGHVVGLFDAPSASGLAYYLDESRASWAPDERRVLVTNTFLPINESAKDSALGRTQPCALASVDLPSLDVRCLSFEERLSEPSALHVQDVSFGTDDDEAVVLLKQSSGKQTIQRYRLHDGEWSLSSSSSIATAIDRLAELNRPSGLRNENLTVFVQQSLNDPPTLWAADRRSGNARQLWDPNPQFSQTPFGKASVYHWKDKTGYEWTGGLIMPVDYVPGKRYPLIVQMYSFIADEFLTDGTYPTAFAAREFASAGFVVLQIRKKPSTMSEADPQDHLEAYRSAIESLSRAELIDRERVGVVGFSWTCWYALNALVKDPQLFAAATIADGLDNSYMQYLLFAVSGQEIQGQMESIRGARPFGDGLKRWVEQAPAFHLDQVQTPVRIEANGPLSVLQEWELYSSLYMQGKPVDLIYFPRGTHIHQKPLERLESQQGDVDWFRFWLQGYEDPDPSKHSQYQRWNHLKSRLTNDPIAIPTK
jgi:dipeptidyl aminopeptidase/acylaminoacyl peptidase